MLTIRNLYRTTKDFQLQITNMEVAKGSYFALVGESGSGKTMLIETIAGLQDANSGSIVLDGEDITYRKIQNRGVGIVFQHHAVFPHLSVYRNIAYPLQIKKIRSHEIRRQVEELAEKTGIARFLNRMPDTLSGGELQRVALARSLALKPKLLLLDEPLSSLDVLLKDELLGLLKKTNAEGQTIIHVTHDFSEVMAVADSIAVIQNGSILQTGRPDDIINNPASSFVKRLTRSI